MSFFFQIELEKETKHKTDREISSILSCNIFSPRAPRGGAVTWCGTPASTRPKHIEQVYDTGSTESCAFLPKHGGVNALIFSVDDSWFSRSFCFSLCISGSYSVGGRDKCWIKIYFGANSNNELEQFSSNFKKIEHLRGAQNNLKMRWIWTSKFMYSPRHAVEMFTKPSGIRRKSYNNTDGGNNTDSMSLQLIIIVTNRFCQSGRIRWTRFRCSGGDILQNAVRILQGFDWNMEYQILRFSTQSRSAENLDLGVHVFFCIRSWNIHET